MPRQRSRTDWTLPTFGVLLLVQLWAAHAVVFFLHEYAHSFTAFLLGWKANPFALNYARPTLTVLLIQLGIDQNVNEAPIFASGHGPDAALIAAAGMVLGNGLISLSLSRIGYAFARGRNLRGWALFFFWTTVASIGNLIDYVPVRTFTLDGDMLSVERGFGWSPWTVLAILGVPTALALAWLLFRVQPATVTWLFPASRLRRAVIILLTSAILFGFYGAIGLLEGGPTSHTISLASVFLALPISALASWFAAERRATAATHTSE